MKTWLLRLNANADHVDRVLRERLPQTHMPPSLHAGIMRAVRSAAHAPEERAVLWPRWAALSGLACAVVLGIIATGHFSARTAVPKRQVEASAVAQADFVLDLGGNLVHQAPDAALSPLSDEVNKMDRDLRRTEQFLMASLPEGGKEVE